jgi:hypothetical protein
MRRLEAELQQTRQRLEEAEEDHWPPKFWPALPWDEEPDYKNFNYETTDRKDLEAKFPKTKPFQWEEDADAGWKGIKLLGQGTYGWAGLWVKTDRTRNIIDRMVVKEALPEDWDDSRQWRNKLPREIDIHKKIDKQRLGRGSPAFRHLIRHRGYRLMMRQQRYRLFLDLYESGDLYHAVKEWFDYPTKLGPEGEKEKSKAPETQTAENSEVGENSGTAPKEPEESKEQQILSEDFLWHVFRCLVDACLILQNGDEPADSDPLEGWKPITHVDINLSNTFLEPGATEDDWPNVVLSDFGLSFYELRNYRDSRYPANPKAHVLESAQFPHEVHMGSETPIDEKTDVWLIGRTMWQLVTHTVIEKEGPLRDVAKNDGRRFPVCFEWNNADVISEKESILAARGELEPLQVHFSKELRGLVADCLLYNKDDRPSLRELQERIGALARPGYQGVKPSGLRNKKKDEFRVGRKLNKRRM